MKNTKTIVHATLVSVLALSLLGLAKHASAAEQIPSTQRIGPADESLRAVTDCYLQPPKYLSRHCETARATTEQVEIAKSEVATKGANCYLQAPKYLLGRCEAAQATTEQLGIAEIEVAIKQAKPRLPAAAKSHTWALRQAPWQFSGSTGR